MVNVGMIYNPPPGDHVPLDANKPRPRLQSRYLAGLYTLAEMGPLLRRQGGQVGILGRPVDRLDRRRQRFGGFHRAEFPPGDSGYFGLLARGRVSGGPGAGGASGGRRGSVGVAEGVVSPAQGGRRGGDVGGAA